MRELCRWNLMGVACVAALAACYTGVDPAKPDAAEPQDAQSDAPIVNCATAGEGTPCGKQDSGNICRGGACVASYCGDLFVDTAAGEECEDGDEEDGDGCTQCRHDCKKSADCDDKESCNGAEICQQVTHKCTPGTPEGDTTPCKLIDGADGVCKARACVAKGCGDGAKKGAEECDDGNSKNGDGCENDCTLTCKAAADCDDGDLCNGKETCDQSDPLKPVCKGGTKVVCDNTKCTGTCTPADGKCRYPDADKDGVDCRTDCNEKDAAVYPGAAECEDGKDNDCNKTTPDQGSGSCYCWRDVDGDGYAAKNASKKAKSGKCPAGYTALDPATSGNADCQDARKDVFPGQTAWMNSPYCPPGTGLKLCLEWDYNCDGKVDKQYTNLYTSCWSFYGKCLGSGWSGSTAPLCGQKAVRFTCSTLTGSCSLGLVYMSYQQTCH